jgi:hypothetical protein
MKVIFILIYELFFALYLNKVHCYYYLSVGLDEMSPFNPLSVLHSFLEPSYPDTYPTVAVIGISNWRLDNGKTNRAILVQRYK